MAPPEKYPAIDKDREINRAILDGDLEGEEALANKYYEEIARNIKKRYFFRDLVRRGIFSESDCEDLATEVWFIFVRKLRSQWIRKKLPTYYHSLVYRTLKGFYRIAQRKSFREPFSIDNFQITDEGHVILNEPPNTEHKGDLDANDKIMILALAFQGKLEPMRFMMLCLRFFEKLKVGEIASLFDYSKGRISQIIRKEVLLSDFPKYIAQSKLTEEELYEDGLQALLRFAS